MYGNIFNIQRFCTDDGDGIRTLFFFKGCPLRCRWCHNPESQSFFSQISYNERKCISCGSCANVCDAGCHRVDGKGHVYLRKNCSACASCADVCPTSALELTGRRFSVDELAESAMRDYDFYGANGGVTLTGGEPLAQAEFAVELARRLKEIGIGVSIETCGFCDAHVLDRICEYCDAFLFDYKVPFEEYEKYTGVPGALIHENLKRISAVNRVILRCPIIKGVNFNDEHFDGIAQLAKENSIKEIHLLAYHNLGVTKTRFWDMDLGEEFETPDKEQMQYAAWRIEMRCTAAVTVL